jgi:hypothetical protein
MLARPILWADHPGKRGASCLLRLWASHLGGVASPAEPIREFFVGRRVLLRL